MEDEEALEARLHNWSLEEEPNFEVQIHREPSLKLYEKYGEHQGAQGLRSDFATEYLELSDDEDSVPGCTLGGIDTVGLEDDDIDEDKPGANDIETNPWDGLPYSSMYYELLSKRHELPVWKAKDDFVLSLDESQIVLVTGHAGSGKSTQIPQWCAYFAKELGFESGTVVCTQPHALAAASLALQVSREMDLTSIGNEVGYKIPFCDVTSEETFLKFSTDTELLREMAKDPLLERYGIVIIDEVQERTVSTDVLLSLVKVVCCHRENIKIVVICLPHEMPKLEEYFEGVPIVDLKFMEENSNEKKEELSPRTALNRSRVKTHFKRTNTLHDDYVSDAVETIIKCHCDPSTEGNILVFMPHEKEIYDVCERVAREVAMKVLRGEASDLIAIPLHKGLQYGLQQAVYEKPNSSTSVSDTGVQTRQVIICDDIAESSFSLDNIAVVIDSGRRRTNAYNCRIRATSNFLSYTTKLSAELRSSRCKDGGHVYRLYTRLEQQKFEDILPASVTRSELSTDVLLMKRLLQSLDAKFSSCQTLDPPAPEAYMQALEDLDYHGALDENGNLSDLGAVMSEFPLSLPLAKSVIASCGEQCTEEMLTVAAMLVVPNCFMSKDSEGRKTSSRRKVGHPAGDHFTLINVYDAFVASKESEPWCNDNNLRYSSLKLASKVRSDLVSVMNRLELPMSPRLTDDKILETSVKKALLAGFFTQIAKDVDGSGNYLLLRDRHVSRLSSKTSLRDFPEWVIFNEFILSNDNSIVTVSSVTPEIIAEITPSSYIANLPDGEAKDVLLEAVKKLKDKHTSENEAPESSHSDKKVVDVPPRAGEISSDVSDAWRQLSHNENSVNRNQILPVAQNSDFFTQTALDLSEAYRQASRYVSNYDDDEGDTCVVQ